MYTILNSNKALSAAKRIGGSLKGGTKKGMYHYADEFNPQSFLKTLESNPHKISAYETAWAGNKNVLRDFGIIRDELVGQARKIMAGGYGKVRVR